jgi:hypothetical protein
MRYEGNFENDEENGFGSMFWPNGNSYVGYFENNDRTGNGTFSWANGDVYIGGFQNNRCRCYKLL